MSEPETKNTGYQFGTFKGVFTPSILTILGIIMYLRFGWVLGNVGLFKTLLIVLIATSITFLTGLSISALATNMRVGGGGTYFIISRSLGLEAGAAVSLPLFFAQALGIAFYIAGFSESIVALFPFLSITVVSIITLIGLTILSYISADLALRSQFLILAMVAASLISFFMGVDNPSLAEPVSRTIPPIQPFWVVFAVFFPAVTGIEAGVAMSGDLKKPERALPYGTLAAIIISFIVYMSIPIFLYFVVENKNHLLTHPFIMKDVARWGSLVVLGVWGASISSALGALLGAPRTLQALARDKVVPQFIGRGFGPGKDPRIALCISCIIALIAIFAGNLNVIAPILTMFFLTAYGILNLSAALEGLIGSPSWRPKFFVHWGWSLVGAALCFMTMFMINPGATFIALIVSLCVYIIMKKRQISTSWSDMRYGILMLILYFVIHRLEKRRPDEKTWRPNILALCGPPSTRWHLIELADAIASKRGLLTVSTILTSDSDKPSADRIENLRDTIRSYLHENEVQALINVHPANNLLQGAMEMVRAYGFGSVAPNTVLIGETEKEELFEEYAKFIRLVHKQRRNLLIVRRGEFQVSTHRKLFMDVLWRGKQQNAGLMLAIAHMIISSGTWEKSALILKTIVTDANEVGDAHKRLEEFIKAQRLEAKSAVIVNTPGQDVFKTIEDNIHDTNLVFIGMRPPYDEETDENYSHYYRTLLEKTKNYPATVMVLSSQDIEFSRMFESE